MRFGALRQSDRERLREILDATAVFRADEIDVAIELFDETSDYEFIGAYEGTTLAGYACFGATPGTDRTYDLYWIAVHPDSQRCGIGSRLLREVESTLRERAARLLVVETSSRDEYAPTRRFYLGHEYSEVARMDAFYAPGDDRLIFTKHLGLGMAESTR